MFSYGERGLVLALYHTNLSGDVLCDDVNRLLPCTLQSRRSLRSLSLILTLQSVSDSIVKLSM